MAFKMSAPGSKRAYWVRLKSAVSEKRTFEWFSKQVGVLLTWLRINNKGQVTLGYSEYQKWFV